MLPNNLQTKSTKGKNDHDQLNLIPLMQMDLYPRKCNNIIDHIYQLEEKIIASVTMA